MFRLRGQLPGFFELVTEDVNRNTAEKPPARGMNERKRYGT